MSVPLGSSDESGAGSSTSGDVSERQSLVSALEHFHEHFHDDEQQQHRGDATTAAGAGAGKITSLQAPSTF